MPGIDAGVFFRQIGATAEWSMQIDEHSPDHTRRGLTYIDEILSQSVDRTAPDLELILQIRAELLLLSGRHTEASEQAEALESSSDPYCRERAMAFKARCHLRTGEPHLAAEILAQVAPTIDQALEKWRATWMGDTTDRYWISQADSSSPPEDSQLVWRLQAVATADADDMPAFLGAANRSTGFLADSFLQDRQQWVDRMRKANRGMVRVLPPEQPVTLPAVADADPMIALDDILAQLVDGAALLQVISTPQGILTCVARKRGGDVSVFVAPDRPNVSRLAEVRKTWSRAYFNSLRHGAGSPEVEAEVPLLAPEVSCLQRCPPL